MLNLKELAHDLRLKQDELSAILGVKQSQVSMMMNGRRDVRPRHVEALRNAFGDKITKYLEGGGEKLTGGEKGIPLMEDEEVVGRIDLGELFVADYARRVSSSAMHPILSVGDLVFFKKIAPSLIISGEIYDIKALGVGFRLRSVSKEGSEYFLKPINDAFGVDKIGEEELLSASRIVGLIRRDCSANLSDVWVAQKSQDKIAKLIEIEGELVAEIRAQGSRMDKIIDQLLSNAE